MEAISHKIGHNTVDLNYYRPILYLSHSAGLPGYGKSFYVYCTEAIDLSKATLAGDEERLVRERAAAELQRRGEEVRRALPVDAAELINPLLPALGLINQNKK